MAGAALGNSGRFWTAGGLRPADLPLLRAAFSDELPERTASPALVILCGLPGTGKSYFARELAARAPFAWLNSDRTRKLLVARPQYSRREHQRVFAAMHALTLEYLREGYSVVFDATNLNENARAPLYAAARAAGVEKVIIRFTASARLVRQRLAERAAGIGDAAQSDAGWEVYARMAAGDEPAPGPHILVEGPEDVEGALREVVEWAVGAGSNGFSQPAALM